MKENAINNIKSIDRSLSNGWSAAGQNRDK